MNIDPDLLWEAYRDGAFPMANEEGQIEFFATKGRAIFQNCEMRVSRSLAKRIRQGGYQVTFDQEFEQVVRGCIRDQENWLSEELVQVYVHAHSEGWGHSCEVWREGKLVGGVYGMAIGGWFSADSMFHRETDMSKVALYELLMKLKDLGFRTLDAQIMNDHTRRLGCVQVSDIDYRILKEESMAICTLWGGRQAASS